MASLRILPPQPSPLLPSPSHPDEEGWIRSRGCGTTWKGMVWADSTGGERTYFLPRSRAAGTAPELLATVSGLGRHLDLSAGPSTVKSFQILRHEPPARTLRLTAAFCFLTAAIFTPVAVLGVMCVVLLLVCYQKSRWVEKGCIIMIPPPPQSKTPCPGYGGRLSGSPSPVPTKRTACPGRPSTGHPSET